MYLGFFIDKHSKVFIDEENLPKIQEFEGFQRHLILINDKDKLNSILHFNEAYKLLWSNEFMREILKNNFDPANIELVTGT